MENYKWNPLLQDEGGGGAREIPPPAVKNAGVRDDAAMFGLPERKCGITLEDEVVHETQQSSS